MSRCKPWRACVPVLLACSLTGLAGCTGLISEKPVFVPADYDTSGSLLGHYRKLDENMQFVVTRGREGRIVIFGFESKKTGQTNKPDTENNGHEELLQGLYAEAAAIPLGGGDFALQVTCSAVMHDGKTYATWLGGKKSPYRSYAMYGFVAQDRKRDYLWVSTNFYGGGDDTALLFNRYAVEKAPQNTSKDYDVRIIPPYLARPAAIALFRDLIAQYMNSGGGSDLYQRTDRNPQPSEGEKAAIVLNDGNQCLHVQSEGEPPPK
jgi:hypothetical protein